MTRFRETYRIKPPEWEHSRHSRRESWQAAAVGGRYSVERWRLDDGHWGTWRWVLEDMTDGAPAVRQCRTADEGKAMAEAHWRETITRFLEEVTHE